MSGIKKSLQALLLAGTLLASLSGNAQKKASRKATPSPVPQQLILAENEFSKYRIVLPSSPSIEEKKAANVLQNYILQISGAALPISGADKHRSGYEILLGQNDRLDELKTGINFK